MANDKVVLAVFPLVPGLLVYVVLWLALPEAEQSPGAVRGE